MKIQHSSHQKILQAKCRDIIFYDLFQADNDLITQLTTLIDQLFAPLTWILEQTLYRRVQKEDKGWINIDFLHRNKNFQSIFKKFLIPSHSRRKKNFLNKAIQKSLIKRKRNLIKRREYLKINLEVKKVVYLELKGGQVTEKNDKNKDSAIKNIMSERVLRQVICESLREIIESRRKEQNPNKMQIEGQQKRHLDFKAIKSDIVFQGSILKGHQILYPNHNDKIDENDFNKQKTPNDIFYRWCFIYFPSLQQHEVQKIITDLENIISSHRQPQKIELQKSMNNLNITEQSIDKFQTLNRPQFIYIYPLQKMVSLYYPKYKDVCEQIGYSHVDYRKQVLKQREKKREKQKVRLLQSRYLDDKIDLVNNYHVKLQIQKQKRVYWQRKNKQIQEKIRKRQQRRKNRSNRGQEPQKKKDLTERLKQLFNIDQPEQPKPQSKPVNFNSYSISQNSMNSQTAKQQIKQDSVSCQINANCPGFKIMLPKYNQSQPNQSQLNSESFDKLEVKQKKIQNHNINELYESQQNQNEYDDMDSSGEEFQLPKKKKRNNNFQTKKQKKILKHNESPLTNEKKQKQKNQASRSSKITQTYNSFRNGNSNSHSNKNTQNSNTSYNLRHKSPSQGSYLRMAGYGQNDEEYRKKERNQIYEDEQDQKNQHSTGRKIRPRRL